MTGAYGKDYFQLFIERNIEQGSVLYVDKEKSQEFSKTLGIQFPNNFATLDFNTIIRKTNAFVNNTSQDNSERSNKSQQEETKEITKKKRK